MTKEINLSVSNWGNNRVVGLISDVNIMCDMDTVNAIVGIEDIFAQVGFGMRRKGNNMNSYITSGWFDKELVYGVKD